MTCCFVLFVLISVLPVRQPTPTSQPADFWKFLQSLACRTNSTLQAEIWRFVFSESEILSILVRSPNEQPDLYCW